MNFVYDPKIAAQIAAYVDYVPPVKGTKEALAKIDPELAKNPLVFPTDADAREVAPVRLGGAQQPGRTSSSGRRSSGPEEPQRRDASSTGTGGSTPYLLLAPGLLWLALFFLAPLGFLGYQSLQSGLVRHRLHVRLGVLQLLGRDLDLPRAVPPLVRLRGDRDALALLIAYPLAYWIAFRAGRWKNLFLLLIIAPFFVTYLMRTLAWQIILSDEGPVVGILRTLHILGADGRLLATSVAVVAGITYNFLPFMALPLYVSLEQIDPRLLEAAEDLYASKRQAFLRVTLPLSRPGSSPARCSPSSPPPATSSTRSCSARRAST